MKGRELSKSLTETEREARLGSNINFDAFCDLPEIEVCNMKANLVSDIHNPLVERLKKKYSPYLLGVGSVPAPGVKWGVEDEYTVNVTLSKPIMWRHNVPSNSNRNLSTPSVNNNHTLSTPSVNNNHTLSTPSVKHNQTLSVSSVNKNQTMSTPSVKYTHTLSKPTVQHTQTLSTSSVKHNHTSTVSVNSNRTLSTPPVNSNPERKTTAMPAISVTTSYGDGQPYLYGSGQPYTYGSGQSYTYSSGQPYTYGSGQPYPYGSGQPYTYGSEQPYTTRRGGSGVATSSASTNMSSLIRHDGNPSTYPKTGANSSHVVGLGTRVGDRRNDLGSRSSSGATVVCQGTDRRGELQATVSSPAAADVGVEYERRPSGTQTMVDVASTPAPPAPIGRLPVIKVFSDDDILVHERNFEGLKTDKPRSDTGSLYIPRTHIKRDSNPAPVAVLTEKRSSQQRTGRRYHRSSSSSGILYIPPLDSDIQSQPPLHSHSEEGPDLDTTGTGRRARTASRTKSAPLPGVGEKRDDPPDVTQKIHERRRGPRTRAAGDRLLPVNRRDIGLQEDQSKEEPRNSPHAVVLKLEEGSENPHDEKEKNKRKSDNDKFSSLERRQACLSPERLTVLREVSQEGEEEGDQLEEMGANVSVHTKKDYLQVRQVNGALHSRKKNQTDAIGYVYPVNEENGDPAVKTDNFLNMEHMKSVTETENTYHNYQSYLEDLPSVVGNAAKYYVNGGDNNLDTFHIDSGNDQGYSSERSPDEDEESFQQIFREQVENSVDKEREDSEETCHTNKEVVEDLLAALECANQNCNYDDFQIDVTFSDGANSGTTKSSFETSQRTAKSGNGEDVKKEEKEVVCKKESESGQKQAKFTGGSTPDFITKENTFEVTITKTSQGLGLSVMGGIESDDPWAGLIRIKKIYPLQPAWQTGQLRAGDILISANGVMLTGLRSHEALEVLRTAPTETVLLVSHAPDGAMSEDGTSLCSMSATAGSSSCDTSVTTRSSTQGSGNASSEENSHKTSSSSSQNLLTLPAVPAVCGGEFEVTLSKVNGSLGFTLRKYDDSILGHYVRALVKEPAVSDGRIRAGDKITAVNDQDISAMSHAEAVNFLRNCQDTVTFRLYRDSSQTPVSPMSPTETEKHFKPKPLLRKEAMDMLSDLAIKKNSNSPTGSPGVDRVRQLSGTPGSPRRRRLTKTPSPDIKAVVANKFGQQDSSALENMSDPLKPPQDLELKLHQIEDSESLAGDSDCSTPVGTPDSDHKPKRPTFLDLGNGSCSKKQKFMFTPPPDGPQSLPIMGTSCDSTLDSNLNSANDNTKDSPDSLSERKLSNFSYHQPEYQSANLPLINQNSGAGGVLPMATSDQDIPTKMFGQKEGMQGLLKWKGVVFTPDEEEARNSLPSDSEAQPSEMEEYKEDLEDKVITVELNRGWNSRLGFSVQEDEEKFFINNIYADSVAAKDGRLKVGDQVLKVNNECVEGKKKAEVIDMLRKTRGTVAVTVMRKAMAPGT